MITRIEARNYRCFQSLNQELGPFHVLVGPNGSGKSMFLDVIAFLGTFVSEGLQAAIEERSDNFHDLVCGREGSCFELAIEAKAPSGTAVQYDVQIRIDPSSEKIGVASEQVLVGTADKPINTFTVNRSQRNASFHSEDLPNAYGFELNTGFSALANLPSDDTKFPATIWLKDFLGEGVQTVVLDNKPLRAPSPPYQGRKPRIVNGSNLGRSVAQLQDQPGDRFREWLKHVQTALPDLESIRSVLRPEDKHRYLMLKYKNGVEVPSWVVSDGTLRLLALTLLAYLPDFKGIYLVEEPENGVHPTALETIYQSLSSVYDGQVLVTSHSPVLLSLPKPNQLLCFQKTDGGASIITGDQHPALRDWKGEVSLSDLIVSGVLG